VVESCRLSHRLKSSSCRLLLCYWIAWLTDCSSELAWLLAISWRICYGFDCNSIVRRNAEITCKAGGRNFRCEMKSLGEAECGKLLTCACQAAGRSNLISEIGGLSRRATSRLPARSWQNFDHDRITSEYAVIHPEALIVVAECQRVVLLAIRRRFLGRTPSGDLRNVALSS